MIPTFMIGQLLGLIINSIHGVASRFTGVCVSVLHLIVILLSKRKGLALPVSVGKLQVHWPRAEEQGPMGLKCSDRP